MPRRIMDRKNIEPIYPIDEWEVAEEGFDAGNNYRNETVFSLGNGYLGFRGNFEEGWCGPDGTGLDGIYINGFYESGIIKYPETAFGYAEKSQTMLNVTKSRIIRLFVDGEELKMPGSTLYGYKRVLSLKEGMLRRSFTWVTHTGQKIRIRVERFVSLVDRHIAAIGYELEPLNFSGRIRLVSALDGFVANQTAHNDPRVGSGLNGRVLSVDSKEIDNGFGLIVQSTGNSGMQLACAMENRLKTKCGYTLVKAMNDFSVEAVYEIDALKGEKTTLEKYIAYVTSRDCKYDEPGVTAAEAASKAADAASKAAEAVSKAAGKGYVALKHEHLGYLKDFWARADVAVKGNQVLQQGIRFNIFHLLQAAGRDGKTSAGAKGLTGEGYEGHYFWDTETYMLPFFTYTDPETARKLLEYRYNTLDKARERARMMSHRTGALFPWRTINGEECSAYFPGGTAQYHIDADIAHAVKSYMEATDDREFLVKYGAEILFETARLWCDLGQYIPSGGNRFCINCVTGPDEYTAIVNNNCYTNLMARENLLYAFEASKRIKNEYPDEYTQLCRKTELSENEPAEWKKTADSMYIPYDPDTKLYPQDDSFLDKKPWDFDNTPPDKYPLLLHYHPLVIYRHQVCKQADLVLALFLLGNGFTAEEKRINYDFYEKVTTHDSSLSTAVFSIIASEIGYRDKAYEYFAGTARMDLDDCQGNTRDGIHAANMAGTWMCMVYGFAGMRTYDGILSFDPYLPAKLEAYSFHIAFRGRRIRVDVDRSGAKYSLLEGGNISIMDKGSEKMLTSERHRY